MYYKARMLLTVAHREASVCVVTVLQGRELAAECPAGVRLLPEKLAAVWKHLIEKYHSASTMA